MRSISFLCLAACGNSSQPPAPDAPAVVVSGDFSCTATPWPTTAPDPLLLTGSVQDLLGGGLLGGASVEIHSTDGTLLAQTTTSTGPLMSAKGKFSMNIATGGTAPTIYRKASIAGYLDGYLFDAFAVYETYTVAIAIPTQAETDSLHHQAGVAYDPGKGSLMVDTFDCTPPPSAAPGPGLTFEPPPGATVVYANEQLDPDPTLTATTIGRAYILGVTPGTVDLVIHAGDVTYRPWPVEVFADAWTTSIRHP